MLGELYVIQSLELTRPGLFVANWVTVRPVRLSTFVPGIIHDSNPFIEARAIRSTTSLFGQSSGPIFLENLACSVTESFLFECPRSILGTHQCDHLQDAGVQCYGR